MMYGFMEVSGFGSDRGSEILLIGTALNLGVRIWSISDAVSVAKIKNIAYTESQKVSYSLHPVFINTPIVNSLRNNALGLQLQIQF